MKSTNLDLKNNFDQWLSYFPKALDQVVEAYDMTEVIEKAGAVTASRLATILGLQPKTLDVFCRALVASGRLAKSGLSYTINSKAPSDHSTNSDTESPNSKQVESLSQRIMTVLKGGSSGLTVDQQDITSMWKQGNISPKVANSFTKVMHEQIQDVADLITTHEGFQTIESLTDLGAGSCAFGMALKRRHPHITVSCADLPTVCAAAWPYLKSSAMNDNITLLPLNFFEDTWPKDTCLHFGNILHDWSEPELSFLIEKAYSSLPSGGKLWITEALLTPDSCAPATVVYFDLLMHINHGSQQFTQNHLTELVVGAGFKNLEKMTEAGYYSLLMAIK
ncbi:MAG: hypothetical protein HRU19_01390 [Pseudobacteriovorax sp.]|nr:hypothetical protein [Pseudobacteriovorax sp.]